MKGLHVKLMYLVSPKRPDRPWGPPNHIFSNFDVLLTVHLSIFIVVINQLDAQNFVLQ